MQVILLLLAQMSWMKIIIRVKSRKRNLTWPKHKKLQLVRYHVCVVNDTKKDHIRGGGSNIFWTNSVILRTTSKFSGIFFCADFFGLKTLISAKKILENFTGSSEKYVRLFRKLRRVFEKFSTPLPIRFSTWVGPNPNINVWGGGDFPDNQTNFLNFFAVI